MGVLRQIFGDRIISRFAKIVWPAHSPDFTFWGQAMAKVWEAKPSTIPQLKAVVEAFFESLSRDFVKKMCSKHKKTSSTLHS